MARTFSLGIVLAAAAVTFAPRAWTEEANELGRPVGIEGGAKALARLHAALRRAAAGKGRARLVFYGDSHLARDHATGELRRRLQARFGDAGPGFAPIAEPFDNYRHLGLKVAPAGGWTRVRASASAGRTEACGVLGVALEASGKALGFVEGARATRFDLFYYRRPGGGSIEVSLDGGAPRRVSTAGAAIETGFERIRARDGEHRFQVDALGDGPVRLFGASIERSRPGVIVDTLAIPGARARDQLPWDEAVQRAQLRRLAPDLVVLAYGTNELSNERLNVAQYERDLRALVERVQKAAPRASCLLVGPADVPLLQPDGAWTVRPSEAEVVAVQRRVASERGCGYFDLVAFQGGPGSMPRWVAHVPPLARPDHTHFTAEGHQRIAAELERALLEGLGEE
jgi:lysophospholipase L1-like esterase